MDEFILWSNIGHSGSSVTSGNSVNDNWNNFEPWQLCLIFGTVG